MASHLTTGKEGEERAEKYLRGKGYAILGRNVKTKRGEIDLIAKQGEDIVFVEVKTRSRKDLFSPSDRVNGMKVGRLQNAAALWLEEHGGELGGRIDVIGVCEGEIMEHYEDVQR